ncbi:MAG TPA: hypothetical protein PKV82_03170 [Anaerolineae bacterium]|nr:hypothetical protein [Anaerolineae bacterium]
MDAKPGRRQLLGIFLTSIGALALEIVLTRIFSVTLWYHFAFLAISLALMGSATAGVVLYFFPRLAQPERASHAIAWASLALALAIPATLLLYLQMPLHVLLDTSQGFTAQKLLWLVFIYLDLSIPFFLSGFVISLALSTWAKQAGQLYWADLIGAATGCLFSILALEHFGGTGAMFAIAGVIALAGVVFTVGRPLPPLARRVSVVAPLLILAVIGGLLIGVVQDGWFAITSTKGGGAEPPRVYEKWNAHSRVSVYEPANYPFFWSVDGAHWDETIARGGTFRHALLLIDAVAGTPIQGYDGALNQVEFLRYDLTSFVYNVTEAPLTLVIGPGGGRDVLAALASGAPHVTAVEVNPAIIEAVRGPFAEFSGHLYDLPEVTVKIADARGYIARSTERYDVIQASLIDTWAAGGSGAFALSENSLYTQEAFYTYYEHLTERGIMSVSRWYQPERPAEMMRLVSTAMAGWKKGGIADPRQHIIVVARTTSGAATEGLATALFKRTPFTPEEVGRAQAQAASLGFTVIYAPGQPATEPLSEFILSPDWESFIAGYPLDISPATDDRPFFFNLVRVGDLLDPALTRSWVYRVSMEAIYILGAVIAVTTMLSVVVVVVPLSLGSRRGRQLTRPSARLLSYFALLGVSFMLVEVPLIQKLTVYLGRPVYSLAIVLFTLLLFSSLGSLWSSRWSEERLKRNLRWVFPTIAVLVILHAGTSLWPLPQTMGLSFGLRLFITMLLLAPLALLMGIPFPSGVRWAGAHRSGVIPWLWGINGVMSVLGSALATALAIHVGFHVTLLIAAGLYALAGVALHGEMALPAEAS